MFTFRRVLQDGLEANRSIGSDYTLVLKEKSQKEFDKTFKLFYGDPEENLEQPIYGFIITEGGKDIIPLYVNSKNYMMTDSGKTYANITSGYYGLSSALQCNPTTEFTTLKDCKIHPEVKATLMNDLEGCKYLPTNNLKKTAHNEAITKCINLISKNY